MENPDTRAGPAGSTPSDDNLRDAARCLLDGGLVVFPTETVYGLGAHALDGDAVHRVFEAKGRPPQNPLIVHVADADGARRLALVWPPEAEAIAQALWPGPVTIVVSRGLGIPDVVTASGPTVALRVPAHPIALKLLRFADAPIAAPSANESGRVSPTRADHVSERIRAAAACVIDGGPCNRGIESTVVDVTVRPVRVLRPGAVSRAELEVVLGQIASTDDGRREGQIRSPGQLGRHYAPRARLVLIQVAGKPGRRWDGSDRFSRRDAGPSAEDGRGVETSVFVLFEGSQVHTGGATIVAMPPDPAAYAHRIYSVLQELDRARVDTIYVEEPPATPEWEAVRDRLRRASLR